jgi:hypothetical protein
MSLEEQIPSPTDQQQGYQAAPPPQPGTSGLAIAGLILAFLIAPLGFILSLIAIFKTGKGRSKGRGLAIAGVIISALIIAGGTTFAVVVANSTLADPGCVAGKAAIINGAKTVDATSLQTTVDELKAAAAKAKHDDVRAAMNTLAGDYSQLVNAMKSGEMPAGLQDKITADGQAVDSLCSIGG